MIVCPCCRFKFVMPMSVAAVTHRQRECLAFVSAYQVARGVSPAFEDIKRGLGLKSKSEVHRLINGLEKRGALIRIHGRARAIELTEAGMRAIHPIQTVAA